MRFSECCKKKLKKVMIFKIVPLKDIHNLAALKDLQIGDIQGLSPEIRVQRSRVCTS